jgi:hypothetical protein
MKKESALVASHFPEAAWIAHVSPDDKEIEALQIMRNLFMHKCSIISDGSKVALYVNCAPHLSAITVDETAHRFRLNDLHSALGDFFSGQSYSERCGQCLSLATCPLPFERLDVWFNFKIQCKSAQDATIICPLSTVQALPPNDQLPYGRCNTVLVDEKGTSTDGMEGELSI